MACNYPYSGLNIPKWNEHLFSINNHLKDLGVRFKVSENNPRNHNSALSMLPIGVRKIYILGRQLSVAEHERAFSDYMTIFGYNPGIIKGHKELAAFNGQDLFIIHLDCVILEGHEYLSELPYDHVLPLN